MITGTGKQTRDFVYVSDVVRANMAAMNRAVTGAFNIGTGKQTSVNTLWRKMKKHTGYGMAERHVPACPGEVMRSALNCRKAARELGWVPKVKLEEGLKKTVRWYKGR